MRFQAAHKLVTYLRSKDLQARMSATTLRRPVNADAVVAPSIPKRTLIELPYSSYLVDVLAGPPAWRFIAAVPPQRGIVVGAGDAHSETMDETEVLVWAMAWAAEGERGSQRVGLAPNASLCLVPRHFAHRKLLRVGEAVSIANMGPLHDVAEALEPKPLASKMAELRTMAEAVMAGRAAAGRV